MANPLFSMASTQGDVGPLGGFLAGKQDALAEQRELAEQEQLGLRSEGMRMDIEKARLNSPADAAKRHAELVDAEMKAGRIASGETQKGLDAETEFKIQQALSVKTQREQAEIARNSETTVQAARMVPTPEEMADKSPMEQQGIWDSAYNYMQEKGIKGVPQQYSYKAHQELQKRATIAPVSIRFIQDQAIEQQKAITANAASARDSAEALKLAGVNNDASMARTRYSTDALTTRAAASNATRAAGQGITPAKVIGGIMQKFANGEALTDEQKLLLEQNLYDKATGAIDKNIEGKMLNLKAATASGDGEAMAKARADLEAAVQVRMGPMGPMVKAVQPEKKEPEKGKKAARTVKRRGTRPDGKRVVEYSDGTIEEE